MQTTPVLVLNQLRAVVGCIQLIRYHNHELMKDLYERYTKFTEAKLSKEERRKRTHYGQEDDKKEIQLVKSRHHSKNDIVFYKLL